MGKCGRFFYNNKENLAWRLEGYFWPLDAVEFVENFALNAKISHKFLSFPKFIGYIIFMVLQNYTNEWDPARIAN